MSDRHDIRKLETGLWFCVDEDVLTEQCSDLDRCATDGCCCNDAIIDRAFARIAVPEQTGAAVRGAIWEAMEAEGAVGEAHGEREAARRRRVAARELLQILEARIEFFDDQGVAHE